MKKMEEKRLPALSSNDKKPPSPLGCLACFEKVPILGRDPISILQLICYSLCLFFGFFVCIPIGVTLTRFNRKCILFAQLVWDQKYIWPWGETSCDFLLYMNLAINIIYATLMILFILLLIMPKYGEEAKLNRSKMGMISKHQNRFVVTNTNPVMCVVNVIIWFLHLSSAIIITVGFVRFCNSMEESLVKLGTPMTCAESQSGVDWTQYKIVQGETDEGPNGSGFFTSINIATICSWILLVIWTFQVIINFSQVCTRCSCEVAEEKVKIDVSHRIAARRSRMATPSHTPGGYSGGGIPVGPPAARGPPSTAGSMPPAAMRGPPSQSGYVLQAPPGWGRGPQSTSSTA